MQGCAKADEQNKQVHLLKYNCETLEFSITRLYTLLDFREKCSSVLTPLHLSDIYSLLILCTYDQQVKYDTLLHIKPARPNFSTCDLKTKDSLFVIFLKPCYSLPASTTCEQLKHKEHAVYLVSSSVKSEVQSSKRFVGESEDEHNLIGRFFFSAFLSC